MKKSFFVRIAAFFVSLLLITLILTCISVLLAIHYNVAQRVERELVTAGRVLEQTLRERSDQLRDRVSALTEDFAFRMAIATGDQDTVESALANQGERAQADVVMWVNREGRLLASTHHDISTDPVFPLPDLLTNADRSGKTTVIPIEGSAYQVALVPVHAPVHIGWILMGFAMDDALLRDQRSLTGTEISLLLSTPNAAGEILASTLNAADRTALASLQELPAEKSVREVALGTNHLLTLWPVSVIPGGKLLVVLQVSLDEAYAPYRELRWQLFSIMLLSLLFSIVGAIFLARSISQPISLLREASQRVARGNYSSRLDVGGSDELKVLADTFNTMQKEIADREERIIFQSQHDSLTGLPNRSVLEDRVAMAIARAQREQKPSAMLALNIRRFKEINDTMGQLAGDQVLKSVAERMREHLRATDSIIRLSSDDFLAILEAGSREDLLSVIHALLEKLGSRMCINKLDIHIKVMVGVAFFPEHGETGESLLRRTDIALNLAREKNETLHLYADGEDEVHLRRLQVIADLPDAINSAKMFMVYQPKVAVATRKASHVEALVRWIHPEYGFISPEEFVMLAEQSGNVKQLTHFVIRTVISQQSEWAKRGININVAINLSALDLLDPSLPEVVSAYLRTYKVDPGCITFEITESALMQEPELSIRVLHELKGSRLRLSIDDFGTGYSSLSQLKRLPVDELKIDKSFIMEIMPGSEDAAIVRSTIDLGHNLGLKVIAEGVENESAWDLLSSFGCDFVQGYLISRPLSIEDLEAWWKQDHKTDTSA